MIQSTRFHSKKLVIIAHGYTGTSTPFLLETSYRIKSYGMQVLEIDILYT